MFEQTQIPTSEKTSVSHDKKRYEKPVVQSFGGLRELTRKVGTSGHTDGGSLPAFRTH